MSKSKSKCDEIKVILLGESGVGKTNIINISTGHSFNDEETATTYSTYSVQKYSIGEKVVVKVVRASKEDKTIDFEVVKKV